MKTTPLTVPGDATSAYLLGYLKAAKGWEYLLSYGADEHWATTYYRTEGPFKGYKIDVPQHDEDPNWLRMAAAVINGVEHDVMPACGLSLTRLTECARLIREILQSDRTERVELAAAVTLMGVCDSWYGASDEARNVLGSITRGMPLSRLTDLQKTVLNVFSQRLDGLAVLHSDLIGRHPAMLADEAYAWSDLSCCYGQHYNNPGTAYVHEVCGGLLRPWGDVHEHDLCTCYGPVDPWMPTTPDAHMTVIEI